MFETIMAGTGVFVMSQYFLELVIKPIQRYREAVYNIDYRLKLYANKFEYQRDQKELLQIRNTIRELACELEASYKKLIGTRILELLGLSSRKDVSDAVQSLIFISNSVGFNRVGSVDSILLNHEEAANIRNKLHIESLA